MERRGEAEGQMGGWVGGGEIWMSLKVHRESRPEAEAARWCRVGWEWGLKGDGLFANCGHFWPEHDGFNDHFNAWLNRAETWNAVGGGASVFRVLFSDSVCEERVFIHGSSTSMGTECLLAPTFSYDAVCFTFQQQQSCLLSSRSNRIQGKQPADIHLIRTIHQRWDTWREKWVLVYLSYLALAQGRVAVNKLVKSEHGDCDEVKAPAPVRSHCQSPSFRRPPFYQSRLGEPLSIRWREREIKINGLH